MFDNPKKELQELEDQLLAAEEYPDTTDAAEATDDEFQSIYAELLAEFGPERDAADEVPIRNFANGYGRNLQTIHSIPQKPVENIREIPVPREHFGFLTFLFCVECLALTAVALCWLESLL